tara:strand:+ start:6535 stop:6780 length:246 start_codon:yes stop_codon:yes gene_type:complete
MEVSVDFNEILVRAVKYLLEAFFIAIVAWLFDMKLSTMEIVTLALTGACVFAILDTLSPVYQQSVRQGVGLASGIKMMGGI